MREMSCYGRRQRPGAAASYCTTTLAGVRPPALTAMAAWLVDARRLPLRSRLAAAARRPRGAVSAQMLVAPALPGSIRCLTVASIWTWRGEA